MAKTPTRTCPICNRPLGEHEDTLRFRPFCSKRCADVDLGRWLKGAYAIPVVVEDEDGDKTEDEAGGSDDAPRVRH
jgi:endogenous inhibitor of DNA gyrase (YacG/DUF329 family)